MKLPTEKTKPVNNSSEFLTLIYGPGKIGKSTFCSNADNAIFLATEPGLNHLEVFEQPITTWKDMMDACSLLERGSHQFRTVIIDTVDNAYKLCTDYICNKRKIEHVSDLTRGKGYDFVNQEFHRVINKLAFLPGGLILVSHSRETEVTLSTGKHTKIVPTLPPSARKFILGLVDLILFCDHERVEKNGKTVWRRVIRTKPSVDYEAGDRTGRLPEILPLDFKAFQGAFSGGARC